MCTGEHPFIPVPDVARIVTEYTHNGVTCLNVFHVRETAGLDIATLDAMGDVYVAWEDAYGKALRSTTTTLERIVIRALDLEDDLQLEYSTGLPISGTGTSPAMPGNVTTAIKFGSAYSGRSNRGRLFHIGLREDMVNGNELVGSVRLQMEAAYDNFVSTWNAFSGTANLVVVSYCSNGVWRTTGQSQAIISASVDPTIDTQRRRLRD